MVSSVVVLSRYSLLNYLKRQLPNIEFEAVTPGTNEAISKLGESEVLIADADLIASHLDYLHSIKWIQTTWAGLDFLTPHLAGREIPFRISRFSDSHFGLSISEYTIAGIVNYERNQREQYENQRNRTWSSEGKIFHHRVIADLTVGILGIGTIGKCVAQILRSFGARVFGLSRTLPNEKLEYLDRHVTLEGLPEILKACDYVINILPLTEETRGLLNGDVLKNCAEKKSVFINVGRGKVVRETDLVRALEQGWLSAAILDVFEEEPLPETSKLWNLPQVTISPHISGVTRPQSVAKLFAENYERYLKGEEIPNTYDQARGY